ncbi:MAG TPA: DUF167 domain-containing protein [Candidatus Paceibacterota bacterium]|nr:DUF167 domain-containing protein [Candidatus Paceibacterota bacterium]
MEVRIRVTTNARGTACTELSPGVFSVSVSEKPIDGKANDAVCRVLAAYFETVPSAVRIIRGHRSPNKIARILL